MYDASRQRKKTIPYTYNMLPQVTFIKMTTSTLRTKLKNGSVLMQC